MKYIITERQYGLLIEQEENSAESCDKNKGSGNVYFNTWKSMNETKRNQLLGSIKNKIEQTLEKSKQEYIKWFKNPLTIKKFKTKKEMEVLKKLPNYLQNIKKVNIRFKGPNSSSWARAWVTPTLPYEINYNLSEIHNGENFVGQSVEYTTKHEMGHLIDYFFKQNGVRTYIQTIDTSNQESYNANYIVNDADQYTRLNVLRGIIDVGPADSPATLLSKFLASVKSGKIKSNKFDFSGIVSKNPPQGKNNTNKANEIYKYLNKSIFVDGVNIHNIEQLFSNFAVNSGGTIYVSFDLLAQLNITSKELDKKYYYLRIIPK